MSTTEERLDDATGAFRAAAGVFVRAEAERFLRAVLTPIASRSKVGVQYDSDTEFREYLLALCSDIGTFAGEYARIDERRPRSVTAMHAALAATRVFEQSRRGGTTFSTTFCPDPLAVAAALQQALR